MGATTMKTTRKVRRKTKPTRFKKAKTRAPRAILARIKGPHQVKHYTLVNGIPETLRNPSAGRKILESLEKRGSATNADVRSDWPKMPTPTIGFYLGKFQQTKVIRAK